MKISSYVMEYWLKLMVISVFPIGIILMFISHMVSLDDRIAVILVVFFLGAYFSYGILSIFFYLLIKGVNMERDMIFRRNGGDDGG